MGQLIVRKSDGSEKILRDNISDNTSPIDIYVRNECIAIKAWSEEDIVNALIENGYNGTDEELSIVMNGQDWDALSDCTDDDWEFIYQVIENHREELERLNDPEDVDNSNE